MKIIAEIIPNIVGGEFVNKEYIKGSLVALTAKEVSILNMLNEASKNHYWDWQSENLEDYGHIKDENIEDALKCVYVYCKARFQINELEDTVRHIRGILTKIEENE